MSERRIKAWRRQMRRFANDEAGRRWEAEHIRRCPRFMPLRLWRSLQALCVRFLFEA